MKSACVLGNLAPARACHREKQSWRNHCFPLTCSICSKQNSSEMAFFLKIEHCEIQLRPSLAFTMSINTFLSHKPILWELPSHDFQMIKFFNVVKMHNSRVNSCLSRVRRFQRTFLSPLLSVLMSASIYCGLRAPWPSSEGLCENAGTKMNTESQGWFRILNK